MRPKKREREEPNLPVFKDGEEALKWCKERLRRIAPEWVNLSILEKVYSGSSIISQLPAMSLEDLLATLSGFRVHESMPSLREVFRKIRNDRLTYYSLDSFLASYRTELSIKRTEIGGHLATLAIVAGSYPKLEKFYKWLEGVQGNFDNYQLPRFCLDLRNRFLTQLYQDLFSVYGGLEAEMNGQGGIFQRLIPALGTEDQISLLQVHTIQIRVKANFFYRFTQYLGNYLISERMERDFSAKNAEINGKFHRLFWDAKLTRELLSTGDLQHYLQSAKNSLNEKLIEYQAISWDEFRDLDFVSVLEIMRENIERSQFLKLRLGDDEVDDLLEKFSIMLELLELFSSGENLQPDGLQDAINLLSTEEADLRQLHERAQEFEKEAPFLPQIFKEYFEHIQKWREDLVDKAGKAYDTEIENINTMLEAFENSIPEGEVTDISLKLEWLNTCSSMLESIGNTKRVYFLGAHFYSTTRITDSLNHALNIVTDWRLQLVNVVKAELSEISLEQFQDLLPLFQGKVADWRELCVGAFRLWADRQETEITSGINKLDRIHNLLGKFLRGQRSVKKGLALQLFSSAPESVNAVCGKVVNWLQTKIQLIKNLLDFSTRLEVQKDLSELWVGRQSMLEKLAEAYQWLGNLPKIQKNQLMESEVDNLQKNGRLLAFAQNALNNLRPSIKELISNAVADVAKAEGLQVKTTNALLQLKNKFSNLHECERFLEAINADALTKEHRLFFKEFYFPHQQAEHLSVCQELSSFQEILNRYLEVAKQAEDYGIQGSGNNAEPESPHKKSRFSLDDEPSSPPQLAF